jgi:hypothetical protein
MDGVAGDPARPVRRQKRHDRADIVRLADALAFAAEFGGTRLTNSN